MRQHHDGEIIANGTDLNCTATAGDAVNLAINTLTYAGVLLGLLWMNPAQIRQPERPERHPPVLHSLREGVAYAVRTPLVLWCLVLLAGIDAFGFNFQILLPLFATGVLNLEADGYGLLFAALGIGSLSGSLTLAFMHERRSLPLMLVGGFAFSLLLVGIGLSRQVWMAAPLIVAAGYTSMLMINTINATVQANVPDELRGRVMSFYVTVFAGSAPLGGLFAGAVAEAFGTPAAFLVGSILSLATVAIVTLGLRNARRRGALGITVLETARGHNAEPAAASDARPASAAR